MTDVTLLHGAWHQPAHFDDLAGRLAAAGLRTAVPDLFGLTPTEGQQLVEEDAERTGNPPTVISMAPDEDGNLRLDPESARAAFYADCTDAVADRAMALLRPEPPAIFAAAPSGVRQSDVPAHYVASGDDRSLSASLSDTFAARCDTSETWPTSHSAYLSQPERIVALVLELMPA